MCAAALVAYPAGDADRESELQVRMQLLGRPGEAVCNAAPGAGVLAQYREKVLVCIALVQKDWLAEALRELELPVERLLLHRARGEVAEIVESAFSDGDDLGVAGERG